MNGKQNGGIGQFEGAYGPSYVTGHLHRQRAWQQAVLAEAEQERQLRDAGITPGGLLRAIGNVRPRALLGGVAAWAARLQSVNARPVRPVESAR